MRRLYLGILAQCLVVASCHRAARPPGSELRASSAPAGAGLYAITCSGNRSTCYLEAGKLCPAGYEIRDVSDQRGSVVHANTTANALSPYTKYAQTTAYEVPTYNGDMLIECKRPAVTAAEPAPPTAPERWQEPFPRVVAGYQMGSNAQQFAGNCSAAQAVAVAAGDTSTCPRPPKDLPFDVESVAGTFCAGQLCELVMNLARGQPTEGRRVQTLLEQKYGPSQAAQGFVTRCGAEEEAFVAFQRVWRWGDEFSASSITLSFDCATAAGPPLVTLAYRDAKGEALRAQEREAQQKNF